MYKSGHAAGRGVDEPLGKSMSARTVEITYALLFDYDSGVPGRWQALGHAVYEIVAIKGSNMGATVEGNILGLLQSKG